MGFPSGYGESDESGGSGMGAFVRGVNLMALSAVSENPEGAWDFARYYLTEEYQRSLESSLPVNRRLLEEWAQEETRRSYYTDEKGEKVESVTAAPFEDKNVMNIIYEEMGSYFSGQKTAEDAAALIQNRVQMYVQENL